MVFPTHLVGPAVLLHSGRNTLNLITYSTFDVIGSYVTHGHGKYSTRFGIAYFYPTTGLLPRLQHHDTRDLNAVTSVSFYPHLIPLPWNSSTSSTHLVGCWSLFLSSAK